ncbi:hypothetical protein LUX33_39200 [Actinomadura madurae]|uniref:hypothetical protein n=1 Tax=Actinomadura madurae TaxID=1993 RepID=UPI0020D22FE5|nr:hypothetical protein [Actinomadura madurae]MCP9953873.1 hypothetical protein [Actinomadura madurae]
MRDERILDLLITYLREGNVADPVISLFADLGDPRGIPVLRDYITELEASDPEEGCCAAGATTTWTRPAPPSPGSIPTVSERGHSVSVFGRLALAFS